MKPKLSRTAAILFTLLASAIAARAQTDPPRPPDATTQTPPPVARDAAADLACTTDSPRASADENFELNITERHIVEECFEASTDVSLGQGDARGVRLRVGVNASAERIDVWLRGVRGRVRFRSSLEELLRRIGGRAAPGAN
ncbi:MAG TPA: hypothetical protein VFX96_12335 [Pyrinomonadaceae bacterium]|nr:hypothetical protein [Pyrinomonadaceae bacterium]